MKALTVVIFFLTVGVAIAQPATSSDREIVITNVNVIPMDSERVLQKQTIVVSKGVITTLGPSDNVKHKKNALVIDGSGKYIIPGLAEMHAHVPPIDDIEPMKDVLTLFAVNGITTIRGMLGHPRHLELREKVKKGEILGPHFYTTGPSINGMSVTSPEAGADMVRRQKQAGYDFLKLHPGLTRAKFDSIAATANRLKIPFAGHVSFGVGVWRAIEAGYSSIDHLDGFVEALVPGIENMVEQQTGPFALWVAHQADTTKIPQLISALKSKGIAVVPTQSLAERWFSPTYTVEDFRSDPDRKYMNPKTVEQWINSKNTLMNDPKFNVTEAQQFVSLRRRLIRECQRNGIMILLGCDAPQIFNVPGFSTHNELKYLVDSGLTPFQALQAGTTNVAKYLNKQNTGVIKVGAASDFLLLSGNPLTDITQTKNIAGVMLGTQWMDKNYIEQSLKKLEKR